MRTTAICVTSRIQVGRFLDRRLRPVEVVAGEGFARRGEELVHVMDARVPNLSCPIELVLPGAQPGERVRHLRVRRREALQAVEGLGVPVRVEQPPRLRDRLEGCALVRFEPAQLRQRVLDLPLHTERDRILRIGAERLVHGLTRAGEILARQRALRAIEGPGESTGLAGPLRLLENPLRPRILGRQRKRPLGQRHRAVEILRVERRLRLAEDR